FAKLSGDFNPVHLDPVAARRVVAGQPIVHGIHLLLRALELHFTRAARPKHVSITGAFLRPAFLKESIRVESNGDGSISLRAGGIDLALITINPRKVEQAMKAGPNTGAMEQTAGAIELRRDVRPTQTFPRLTRVLGSDVVAALAGVSNVVGMEYPGRDSLLSAVRLDVTAHARATRLGWRVARTDDRFGLV